MGSLSRARRVACLWQHVDRVVLPVPTTGPDEVGKLDFIAKDPVRLRAELRSRSDFGDLGAAQLGWPHARTQRTRACTSNTSGPIRLG